MRSFMEWGATVVLLIAWNVSAKGEDFVDIQLHPDYREAVLANQFLMHGAVDVITTANDGEVLVGVGVVALKEGSNNHAASALAAQTVAKAKAKRAVAQFLRSDVSTESTIRRETREETVQSEGGQTERVKRVQRFFETHIAERATMVRRVKDLGSWMSSDRTTLYAACGVFPEP